MKSIIANLLKIKSIITLAVLALLWYTVIHGMVEGKFIETVVMMVISFYFGTQHGKASAEKSGIDMQPEGLE